MPRIPASAPRLRFARRFSLRSASARFAWRFCGVGGVSVGALEGGAHLDVPWGKVFFGNVGSDAGVAPDGDAFRDSDVLPHDGDPRAEVLRTGAVRARGVAAPHHGAAADVDALIEDGAVEDGARSDPGVPHHDRV